MKLPKYELEAEDSLEVFEFISIGKKGSISKILKFSETSLDGFYNLAFGDRNLVTGDIDDKVVSDNGDSERVLATVVSAVYAFTSVNLSAWVYATGSTPARTRLYKMGISKYLQEVRNDFEVYGLYNGEWEEFVRDKNYTAFVIRRINGNFI